MNRNRILIFGNTSSDNSLYTNILERNGFKVQYMLIADFSTNTLDKLNPDLILINLKLDESNYKIINSLKKPENQFKVLPMIYIASDKDEMESMYYSNINFEGFLFKPVKARALISTIRTTIKRISEYESKVEKKMDILRGNISLAIPHEFNTSINTIMSSCSIMNKLIESERNKINFTNEFNELFKTIIDSCRYMSRLTENFTLFSQLQIFQEQPDKLKTKKIGSSNSTQETFLDVIDILTRENDRLDDFILELEDSSIFMSHNYFHKIIFELLDNALKFSEKNCKIIINSYHEGEFYKIIIKDNGRGMSSEQITSIGAYQQFDRITHEQQGAGLGLILTKLLVLVHGGTFNIYSVQNVGTTIQISIPAVRESIDETNFEICNN